MAKDLLLDGEIHLFGDVGDTFWGDGFTPEDVANALAAHGDGDVTARINSGGGIATDGMAIYSLLKAHPGEVTIVVDGIAASAASLIAMAGDKRVMRDGAMMMIHDPATITVGNAAAHDKARAVLDKLADNYAGVYARASGMERPKARDVMKAETWLTADEAVAEGFATDKIEEQAATAAAFDYKIYMRTPAAIMAAACRPPRAPRADADRPAAPADLSAARARMRIRQG